MNENDPRLAAERTYTREEVRAALNRAANLVQDAHDGYEDSETIRMDDAVNLAVNAAGYLLDHPAAGPVDIIPACYADVEITEDDMDEGEAVPEKGSPGWGELLTAKVLGWVT